MAKDFKPRDGSRLTVAEAAAYGKRLDWLASNNSGSITAKEVLADAEKKESPLHAYFEWDDSKAAIEYRLYQARNLLRSIEVVVTRSDGTEMQVRQYYSITEQTEEGQTQSYYMLGVVLNNAEKRAAVIADAYREVVNWQLRYEQYQEFNEICSSIRKFNSSRLGPSK